MTLALARVEIACRKDGEPVSVARTTVRKLISLQVQVPRHWAIFTLAGTTMQLLSNFFIFDAVPPLEALPAPMPMTWRP